jgi:hypothetical protein
VEVSLDLDLNDVFVITDPDSMVAFELPGAASAREYRVIVQSASDRGGGFWPMKFVGEVSTATASASSVSASYGYAAPASAGAQDLLRQEAQFVRDRQRSGVETVRMQERAWDELRRIGARVAPVGARVAQTGAAARAAAGSGSAQARLAGVPSNGDEVEFIMPVGEDLSLDCTNTEKVLQAEIVSVGDHFVIARDMQGTDAFSESDYAEIQAVLDDFIYEVDTEYFGETADIDENERVIVLITEEVNKLADLTEQLIFLGFFLPSDLASPFDCPASNAGEIVYLRAPDPDGEFA